MRVLLIFLFLIPSSEHRLCVGPVSFTVSTIFFNAAELENKLINLKPINVSMDDCYVALTLNYNEHLLEVLFSSKSPTSDFSRIGHPILITTFKLDNDSTSVISVLEFRCLVDVCDQVFALNQFFWLLEHNHTKLQQQLSTLLSKNIDSPIQCLTETSTTTLTSCKGQVCNGLFIINQLNISKEINYDLLCGKKTTKSITVRITTKHSFNPKYKKLHEIFYTCMYNGCNNKNTSQEISYKIHQLYDISKIIDGIDTDDNNQSTIIDQRSSAIIDQQLSTMTTTTSTISIATQNFQTLPILINISCSILYIIIINFNMRSTLI